MNSKQEVKSSRSFENLFQNGEDISSRHCKVTGCIPTWLQGSLIRNGPGEFKIGEDSFKHWFDGHALIHKFEIENGQVLYSSKFTQSKDYKINHQSNKVVLSLFGTASIPDPCKNVFSRFFAKFISRRPDSENCNVNIFKLGKTHYAVTDGPTAHIINSKSLDSEKFIDIKHLQNMVATTAHPHFDLNGDYYNLGIHTGKNGFYAIYKVPSGNMVNENPLQEMKIHSKVLNEQMFHPCYFHSFGLSENYIILHDQPVRYNAFNLLKASFTWDSLMTAFEYLEDQESVFHVVSKEYQEKLPIRYCSKGRFCFHHINSYEQTVNGKNFLLVDMLCADRPTFFYYWLRMLKSEEKSDIPQMLPYRFVLPLNLDNSAELSENLSLIENCSATAVVRKDGSVFLTPEMILNNGFSEKFNCHSVELPATNYKEYNTKPYTFMYCVGSEWGGLPSQLFKINVQTKEAWQWKDENRFCSEAVFVKDPDSTDEDGGVLLSTVISNDPSDPIYLLVLDAKTFTEIARAEIKAKLPYPLHGCFSSC